MDTSGTSNELDKVISKLEVKPEVKSPMVEPREKVVAKSEKVKKPEVTKPLVKKPIVKTADRSSYNCPTCKGEGIVGELRCPQCAGTGKI